MAFPLDGSSIITDEQFQSGLIVDVQTVNLNDPDEESAIVYEATAPHHLMLVLVGNDDAPRLTMGVAFNHHEFVTPYGPRITDSRWKRRAYAGMGSRYSWDETESLQDGEAALPSNLPAKPFWYDPLKP
jgi:hypothetical protein